MPENAQDFIDSGPEWDPDVLPIKFAGTSIRWSKTGYDSVVIPLIVTCKQVFWDLRLDQFTVAGKELGMRIVCPCVYGRDSKLVALDGGDVEPRSVAAEIERVLNAVADGPEATTAILKGAGEDSEHDRPLAAARHAVAQRAKHLEGLAVQLEYLRSIGLLFFSGIGGVEGP